MKRVAYFIDGYNLYHSIDQKARYRKYKWLDIEQLCRIYVEPDEVIKRIIYFTALTLRSKEKRQRQRTFIRALETRNIEIVYGQFLQRDRYCPFGGKYKWPEEKQTDVNIVTQLFKLAIEDKFDVAMIMTADTDIIPAIRAFKEIYKDAKWIRMIFPVGRWTKRLAEVADSAKSIKPEHLRSNLLPQELILSDGRKITCPVEWQK